MRRAFNQSAAKMSKVFNTSLSPERREKNLEAMNLLDLEFIKEPYF